MNLKQKEKLALAAIKRSFDTPEGEFGSTLFVAHHVEQLNANDWVAATGKKTPNSEQILDSLILIDSWSSEESEILDTFDFGLPHDISDYLLSVSFEGDEVSEIAMES